MEETNRIQNEPGDLKGKLDAAIGKAQAMCQRLQERTAAAAKTADATVREHPYQALGVAFGLGVLIGALVMRGRRD